MKRLIFWELFCFRNARQDRPVGIPLFAWALWTEATKDRVRRARHFCGDAAKEHDLNAFCLFS